MTTNKQKSGATVNRSGHEQAVEFMDSLQHPLKKEIEEVRTIILNADKRLTEHIKWNAPSFCLQGEDRVTFNLQGKGFFRLVFHCGARVKVQAGEGPLFEDTTGLLEWVSGDRAIVKFTDMNDVRAKKDKLEATIIKWMDATSS
ncbi:MAG: hypothetical protein K0R28_6229 [Paenibacillus sp.]|nr:hypothetical protein [Paenibacillus sp.]